MRRKKKELRNILEIVDVIEKSVLINGVMDYRRFCNLWADAIFWCRKHNVALQDFLARESFRTSASEYQELHYPSPRNAFEKDFYFEQAYCQVRFEALRKAAEHLRKGAELGLSDMEQMVLDVLTTTCLDYYTEQRLACAKELAGVIEERLNEIIKHTNKNRNRALAHIIEKLKELTDKYDVWYDNGPMNLTEGYIEEWFCYRYNGTLAFEPIIRGEY